MDVLVDDLAERDDDVDVVGHDDEPVAPLVRTTSMDDATAAVSDVKASLHGIDRLLDKKFTARTLEILRELAESNKRAMAVISAEQGLSLFDVVAANVARGHKKIVQHSKLMLQPRTKKRKLD